MSEFSLNTQCRFLCSWNYTSLLLVAFLMHKYTNVASKRHIESNCDDPSTSEFRIPPGVWWPFDMWLRHHFSIIALMSMYDFQIVSSFLTISTITVLSNGGCRDFPPMCSDCLVTLWSVDGGEFSCGFYQHQKFIHTWMVYQKVAFALLTRGRLSLAQLIRYTKMKPRTARVATLVLVQQNILWHSNTEEEGEMLEFNTLECLMRLRFGRFVWQAEQLFGSSVCTLLFFFLFY